MSVLVLGIDAEKRCPPQEVILPCRCLVKGEEFQIWCSHSDLPSVLEGLRAIGEFIVEPIDELILENNYLPSLPGRTFIPLKVMRLMLRYNGLERVSSDWLVGLEQSLMELFIVEPDLRSLPDDTLIHLNNLEAITVQTNLMKRYPLFSGLPKLRYIQLESLSLLELSSRNFKDLPALETIHISNSPRLTRLEASFLQDLPKLSLVNISYCGISWMHPRAITRLPILKQLSLVGNKIVDVGMVGRGARDLPQLEILRLDHNYIDKITEAAFVDLPSLKRLYLSNNHISELQYGAFHRVPLLRSLYLNKNMVRRVHPESFLQHSGSGLEELWLVDNDISHVVELRSLLDALPRLIFLDMSYNNLEAIPFGTLRGHPTLERLHLDHNKINLIDNEAFMAMPALRELRLKNNSLSDILEGPLWNLPALKGLDLSGNFFRRLEPRLLANLPSLRRIDLSNNELSFIDSASFLLTPALEHINLSHNALSSLHPATFRPLLSLYDLDVSYNYLVEFVPNLPRGIEYVHMSHNKISAIPTPPSPDLDLPSLRMLDISYNEIHRISPNSLRSLSQLRRLYFGKNALQKLDEDALAGLSRLEVINLEGNKIVQIHRKALREMMELKELNLRDNRLDIIFPEILNETPLLKKLDISNNKLVELLPGTLDKTKELQIIDASDNFLVQLPPNLFGMKNLKVLDLANNRLKDLHPETLNSLTSLRELRLANNYIQELKEGAFDNLQHLRSLCLDSNEVEIVEANAVRSLPVLKSLKLSRNKLKEIPNFAFNNLPALQVAELQENQIRNIGNNAFHSVPHLVLLNLSHNHLVGLDDAGLRGLKSLEMLDVSNNKISRVTGANLEQMEWLVELRMNDNNICAVHGSPFNGMPRLRVLNMKNNKMMSLPEQAVQKLRSNIAVLDIDGNPLVCTCNLLWMQAWLQESSSVGPKCADGTLLREVRLSRQECSPEERNVELVAPGCEAELLSAPEAFGTSQVFSPWMNLKANISKENQNHLAPSPEESEYFYDEYVDYPFNDTKNNLPQDQKTDGGNPTPKSPHYTPGDTPTIYAAPKNKTKPDIPKEVSDSPSTSGFTFFGVPLPSLNLKNLLGGNGRMDDKKSTTNTPIAERKMAIVNKPARSGARGGLGLPSSPEVQTGGFVPLLPGSGGFKPIPNPLLQQPQISNLTFNKITTTQVPIPQSTESYLLKKNGLVSMGHPIPTPSPTVAPRTDSSVTQNVSESKDEVSETFAKIEEIATKLKVTTTAPEIQTAAANEEKFEDLFQEAIDNVPVGTTEVGIMEILNSTTELTTVTVETVETIPTPTTSPKPKEEAKKVVATPLSALLVPGGQQPEFRPAGRPIITKVPSPHISGSAPLLSNLDFAEISEPSPLNKEGKTTKHYMVPIVPITTPRASTRDDTSWD
ncbi:LRR 8 domain containing protein [Asbolus verrucosus]|uniref:LRR 8 domain containing protein n=1 Tax=Asbolus verrucosus TaxID=1661398 RepID=A0A482WEV5_ASBVE|nr:LRR 8 domain containing protein [Asbolus verrucosus]